MIESEPATTHGPSRRQILLIGIAVVLAIVLAITIGIAVFGGSDRVLRLEVTSPAGKALMINWSGPDDDYEIHLLGNSLSRGSEATADRAKAVTLPWNMDLELSAVQGPIRLNAASMQGSEVTCRITRGGTVLVEETNPTVANCMVTVQRAFATS